MSPAPWDTADDRPPVMLEERGRSVGASPMNPSEPEPFPAPPHLEASLVASDEPVLRVVAVVLIVLFVGIAGWSVTYAWKLFTDVLAGRALKDVAVFIWLFLSLLVFFPPIIRRLYRVARWGADRTKTIESRAFLEALERHDRELEAQRLTAEGIRDELRP